MLDSEDNDTVYNGSVWDSILGSGLGEVFAGVFNEAPVELVDRLNEAEVDIPSLLGSNLDSLLTDSALSEFETNLSLFDSSSVTMEEIQLVAFQLLAKV